MEALALALDALYEIVKNAVLVTAAVAALLLGALLAIELWR